MNFEYFFARRITFVNQRSVSDLVVKLAIISIALAVATMEISLSVVQGFETAIQNKVVGFASHVQIGTYARDFNKEVTPLEMRDTATANIKSLENVASVAPYVDLIAFCQSDINMDVASLKGVDSTYHWDFFENSLKKGRLLNLSGNKQVLEILISQTQADLFGLNVEDRARLLFWSGGEQIRQRRVKVVGIYETGMEEFDSHIMVCDMRMLQRIWGWDSTQVSGLEVNLNSIEKSYTWSIEGKWPFIHQYEIDPLLIAAEQLNEVTPYDYSASPVSFLYPEIFDWLRLQHQNVWFILVLMVIVALINMSSVVLILIIERTRTIGILKSMGMAAYRVQRMFVWNAFLLIALGLIIGNILGLGLLSSQAEWEWLKLDQQNYFVKVVPVAWVWGRFLAVNLGVILVCTIFMFIPTAIIARISPLQAIRFE